jgi:MinD superfamily P-loop ATPase
LQSLRLLRRVLPNQGAGALLRFHVVAPEKCSGCDLCGMYCPDFAIYGQRLPVVREEAPAGTVVANLEVGRES